MLNSVCAAPVPARSLRRARVITRTIVREIAQRQERIGIEALFARVDIFKRN